MNKNACIISGLLLNVLLLLSCADLANDPDEIIKGWDVADGDGSSSSVSVSATSSASSSSSALSSAQVSSSSSTTSVSSSSSGPYFSDWSTCKANDLCGSFKDERDGAIYNWVKIGDQTWMAENLNYATASGLSWCYDNATTCQKSLGRLYDWAAAMDLDPQYDTTYWEVAESIQKGVDTTKRQGVCPPNWHLPTKSEWNALVNFVDAHNGDEMVGYSLKAQTSWNRLDSNTNSFLFGALPAGYYDKGTSQFENTGNSALFWALTEDSQFKWAAESVSLYNLSNSVDINGRAKVDGLSVRCVGD
jgi:uncharacterized protein (TIGR02145 family)